MNMMCNDSKCWLAGDLELGTHILQFVYVTFGGLRFPIAYFVTKEAQAPEIFVNFWAIVDKLKTFGFVVCVFFYLKQCQL